MLRFFKWFLVSAIAMILTACGGDSSGGTGMDKGDENCISISRPKVGQTTKMIMKAPPNTSHSTIKEETITEFSSTAKSSVTVMTGTLNGTLNSSLTFSISNNYMDATRLVSENSITVNGTTMTSDNMIEYSPFDRLEIDVVCKNQAWTSDFLLKTTASGYSNSRDMIVHRAIESINDTKSVAAGTFNTYRMKMVVNGADVIIWTDIETGAIVFIETYDSAGTLVATNELLTIE